MTLGSYLDVRLVSCAAVMHNTIWPRPGRAAPGKCSGHFLLATLAWVTSVTHKEPNYETASNRHCVS